PVDPASPPTEIRYPAAGTANAQVDLAIVGLDGSRVEVGWATGGWEYLARAAWTDDGLILVVQSRDQKALAVLDVDPATGSCTERYRQIDEHWVELVPGAPRLHGGRLVTVEDRGPARVVCVDGEPVSPPDVQIRRVVHTDDRGVLVLASPDAPSASSSARSGPPRSTWPGWAGRARSTG
ncbi:MAG: DPP IV N-terminal domain-containing protein, partial [Acidimicrobiales bacterium]